MSMFCYQCEQTSRSSGCTAYGVCGKDPDTAALQDVVIHLAKGIAQYSHAARFKGTPTKKFAQKLVESLFSTVTNVNFDSGWFVALIDELAELKEDAAKVYERAHGGDCPVLTGPAAFVPESDKQSLVRQGWVVSIENRFAVQGKDITGLQELLLYGLKGAAAYAHHARILGYELESFYEFVEEALAYLGEPAPVLDKLVALNMRCGEQNLKIMELLDSAHTTTFGHPVPTKVRVSPSEGKAILVSGHDLHDLKILLELTEGKGVNVYTHGEMLPAHGYPELKKYSHLAGNYGGAWQDQDKDFDAFPGAILMTTNCIQRPLESYRTRIFTTGLVGWPGVTHVENADFSKVVDAALAAPGFPEQTEAEKVITVGFGHNAVLGVADKVVDAVKSGAIRHFFLIGGCDGAKSGRNYYTELAKAVPKDCVVMTLACGKYRFNKLEFGEIQGIPRLLDLGQCNDAYSAIKIAVALADAFKTDVNSLPLSLILSWYEQKAVAILLTLLSLGIKNVRIGPSLPAFIGPEVLDLLVKNFGLKPISIPENDLQSCLQ